MQRSRSLLVLWITEDGTNPQAARKWSQPQPNSSAATSVVLVLLTHPELDALAAQEPATVSEMYASTAAQEMLERRRVTLAQLRQQGVLVVETTPHEVGADAITKYLEGQSPGSSVEDE